MKTTCCYCQTILEEYEQGLCTRCKKLPICIIALDGLEYSFIEEWNLKYLQQNYFGKLTVPLSNGYASSPNVWYSFLTGLWVTNKRFYFSPLIERLLRPIIMTRKILPLSLGLGKKIREKSDKMNFPSLNHASFVESLHFRTYNMPYFNYNYIPLTLIRDLTKGESPEIIYQKLYEEYYNNVFNIQFEMLYYAKHNFLAYLHFPDCFQHLLLSQQELHTIYHSLNNFIQILKEIAQQHVFIIISDHGFNAKKETHSKHGFYSSNIPFYPTPNKITDFSKMLR